MRQKQIILVIDDNRSLAMAAKKVLEKEGYCVFTASDGNEGIEKAHIEKPDLIVLDVVMPGINGYDVCRKLKEDDATAHIPVIFLSVKGDIDDNKSTEQGLKEVDYAYRCGANNFLTKPVSAQDLIDAVKSELSFASFIGN